jgi:hypothetical protein
VLLDDLSGLVKTYEKNKQFYVEVVSCATSKRMFANHLSMGTYHLVVGMCHIIGSSGIA